MLKGGGVHKQTSRHSLILIMCLVQLASMLHAAYAPSPSMQTTCHQRSCTEHGTPACLRGARHRTLGRAMCPARRDAEVPLERAKRREQRRAEQCRRDGGLPSMRCSNRAAGVYPAYPESDVDAGKVFIAADVPCKAHLTVGQSGEHGEHCSRCSPLPLPYVVWHKCGNHWIFSKAAPVIKRDARFRTSSLTKF
eukprot:366212-Chlamydomonas_euryale.AAC.28